MPNSDRAFHALTNTCPKCGSGLIAVFEPIIGSSGQMAPAWHVLCDSTSCTYKYPYYFWSIQQLPHQFHLLVA